MLSGSSYIPPFYFYQFADAISAPYTALKAYQSGIIDSNGNILKPESSLDPFEYLVIKLKQIFAQLPYGTTKAKLNGYLSTLQLFAEEAEEYNFNSEYMHALIEGYISQITDGEVSYLELCEDMGSGGGAAGSLGTPMAGSGSNVGVAGFDPPMTDKILKRKYLENCEIFDVCPDEYVAFKNAKAWKHIPDGPTKNYLQRFQRRNKDAKIGIRTTLPESGEQDLYWITYPSKNFMEEYNLNDLSFLIEDNSEKPSTATNAKAFHDAFRTHLLKQNLSQIEEPDFETRTNPEKLKEFHQSMPHQSFYVGDDPNEGSGHDAFVKIDDSTSSGFELKHSKPSKRGHDTTPVSVKEGPIFKGRSRLERAVEKIPSESIRDTVREKLNAFRNYRAGNGIKNIANIFSNTKNKKISSTIKDEAHKVFEQKGDIFLIGHPEHGIHALSSSTKGDSDLEKTHNRVLQEIGLQSTGRLNQWGGAYGPRWINRRIVARLIAKAPTETHESFESYKKNASTLFNPE
jgi:hypothetical protein